MRVRRCWHHQRQSRQPPQEHQPAHRSRASRSDDRGKARQAPITQQRAVAPGQRQPAAEPGERPAPSTCAAIHHRLQGRSGAPDRPLRRRDQPLRARRRLSPTRSQDRKPPSQPRVAGAALPTGRKRPGKPAGWASFRGASASQAAARASLRWILGGLVGCRGWNLSGKLGGLLRDGLLRRTALRRNRCAWMFPHF